MVDPVHERHLGLAPDRLYANDRLRRHPRRFAENTPPHPRYHHRRQRTRLGRRDPRLAAADREFDARGLARQLLSRRRDPCRTERRGDARFHRKVRRHQRLSCTRDPYTPAPAIARSSAWSASWQKPSPSNPEALISKPSLQPSLRIRPPGQRQQRPRLTVGFRRQPLLRTL